MFHLLLVNLIAGGLPSMPLQIKHLITFVNKLIWVVAGVSNHRKISYHRSKLKGPYCRQYLPVEDNGYFCLCALFGGGGMAEDRRTPWCCSKIFLSNIRFSRSILSWFSRSTEVWRLRCRPTPPPDRELTHNSPGLRIMCWLLMGDKLPPSEKCQRFSQNEKRSKCYAMHYLLRLQRYAVIDKIRSTYAMRNHSINKTHGDMDQPWKPLSHGSNSTWRFDGLLLRPTMLIQNKYTANTFGDWSIFSSILAPQAPKE